MLTRGTDDKSFCVLEITERDCIIIFKITSNSKHRHFSSSKKLNQDLFWDTRRQGLHENDKGKKINSSQLAFPTQPYRHKTFYSLEAD